MKVALDLHRMLKVVAAQRRATMQDQLDRLLRKPVERAYKKVVDGGR